MENTPLCKFCGKPMEHNWCGMDEYYIIKKFTEQVIMLNFSIFLS